MDRLQKGYYINFKATIFFCKHVIQTIKPMVHRQITYYKSGGPRDPRLKVNNFKPIFHGLYVVFCLRLICPKLFRSTLFSSFCYKNKACSQLFRVNYHPHLIQRKTLLGVAQISKFLLCHSFDPNYPVFGPRLVVPPLYQSVKTTAPAKACFPKKTNGKEQQIERTHKRMGRNKLATFATRKTRYYVGPTL